MTTQPDYSKIYTHAPEQHPNLILGSLQLLFWLFFRPTAFRNHLKRIHPVFENNTSLITVLREEYEILENQAVRKFILQGFVILPVLVIVIANLSLVALGMPLQELISLFLIKMVGEVEVSMVICMALGVVIGVAINVEVSMAVSIALGMAVSIAFGVALAALGIKFSMILGMAVSMAIGMAVSLAKDLELGVTIIALGIWLSVWEGGNGFGVAATIHSWRPIIFHPLLITWNFLLYRFEQGRTSKKTSLLGFHPAFWDEWLYIPFQGLDKHLLLVIERNPDEGKAAINYLSKTHQRWVVPKAKQALEIELNAQMLEACQSADDITEIASKLQVSSESPVDNILNNFKSISEDTKAALKQTSNYNQRLVLKPICEKLEAQIQGLNRSDNKYAPRFQPIAIKWRDIISNHIEELAKETELRQEIDSPYIIGVPLTLQQQIFTGRDDIGTRIEQLLLDRCRPPLLLYGQRRMGKTSLLNNLKKLLPNSIIPMFVDLQGAPSSAKDSTGFLFNLAKQMINSAKRQSALTLPPLSRETLENDPFTNFDEWLDKVEETLEQNTALLMLDEFEVLDSAINKGRFDEEDVLGMLRNLIQHRPKFKVLIAGSHTIEEYQRWASYLINVQVVHISYLLDREARQLIENPIEDFTLRYEADAVERILQLTRCHPFLVQLLCSELIALKNEQDPSVRRLATLTDVKAAIPEALSVGSFFFADIQNNQVDATGLEILRFIAAKGEKAVVSKETIALEFQDKDYSNAMTLLLQRELIEEIEDGYCFQVELIRQWFEK